MKILSFLIFIFNFFREGSPSTEMLFSRGPPSALLTNLLTYNENFNNYFAYNKNGLNHTSKSKKITFILDKIRKLQVKFLKRVFKDF